MSLSSTSGGNYSRYIVIGDPPDPNVAKPADPRFPPDARRAMALGSYPRGQDVRWLDEGWVRATLPGEKPDGVLVDATMYGQALVEWPPRQWRADRP